MTERTMTWTYDEDDWDVSNADHRVEVLRLMAQLRHAMKIIESYELDCRSIADYLKDNPTGQGFCQGEVYRKVREDMAYWADRAEEQFRRG